MTDLSPALLRFGDVSVRLSVELGRTIMPLRVVGDDPSAASAAPPMPAATCMGAPIDPVGTGFPEPSPAAAASTPPADAPTAEPAPPPPPSAPPAPTEPEVEAAKDAPAEEADDIDDLLDSTLDELTGALDEIAPDSSADEAEQGDGS